MTALGDDFKRAREARSFAIADVASRLHIRAEFLDAIETERWDVIGDHASLRGLLRTYARFIGLDGGEMVARFNQEHEPPEAAPSSETLGVAINLKTIALLVLAGLMVAAVFFSLAQFVARIRSHPAAPPTTSVSIIGSAQ